MRLYTIEGGNERLPRGLAARIGAQIRLGCRLTRVERRPSGEYRVWWRRERRPRQRGFELHDRSIAISSTTIRRITCASAHVAPYLQNRHVTDWGGS
jgi:hypothetical protein